VTATSFSVPEDALPYWKERLASHRVDAVEAETRFGESALVARDPSGLAIELVATHRDRRVPWSGSGIDHASAIRGLHSVTVASRSVARTIAFMTDILGFAEEGTEDGRTRLTINGNVPGHIVDVLDGQLGTSGSGGMGTVHHVAMGVVSSADQLQMRERLLSQGFVVTPVQDRQYFQSIYFREPGGVLFEIATSAPGFTLDEPGDALGRLLKLPSWEEEHRATIEAGLAPVILP
jgi:glyoxalase family protein